MKQNTKLNKSKIAKPIAIGLATITILALIVGLGWFLLTNNYAHNEAGSFESALTKAGAMKQCDTGDAGKGPDNYRPWYSAVFTIPGNREAATKIVTGAAKDAGLNLTDKTDPTPRFDQYYYGVASKKINHSDLNEGDAQVSALVYKMSSFDASVDKRYCTTSGKVDSSSNTTTVLISVGLPAYRGHQ